MTSQDDVAAVVAEAMREFPSCVVTVGHSATVGSLVRSQEFQGIRTETRADVVNALDGRWIREVYDVTVDQAATQFDVSEGDRVSVRFGDGAGETRTVVVRNLVRMGDQANRGGVLRLTLALRFEAA